MPLNEISRNKVFEGLRCPYTRKEVTVRIVAAGKDNPNYFSPDAFDPSIPVASSTELFKKLSTRGGVIGKVRDANLLICPYTGNTMSLKQTPNGFHYAVGGFSPSTPTPDKVAFIRAMMMRDGVIPKDAPMQPARVDLKKIELVETRPPLVKDVSLETERYVEKNAESLLSGTNKQVTISVPGGVPPRAKKNTSKPKKSTKKSPTRTKV